MNLKEAAWFFFPFLKIFMGISLIYHVVLVSSVQQSIILQLFPTFVLFQANGQCLLGAFDSLHGCDCSFCFFSPVDQSHYRRCLSSFFKFTEDYFRIVTCTRL